MTSTTITTTEQAEPIAIPFLGGLGEDFLAALRPKPPRPDQIAWDRNQRKIRKNKRRLFAAGGRVDFKK